MYRNITCIISPALNPKTTSTFILKTIMPCLRNREVFYKKKCHFFKGCHTLNFVNSAWNPKIIWISFYRHQWLLPSLRNGEDISSNFASTNSQMSKKSNIAGSAVFGSPSDSSERKVKSEVYGRTRYGPPRGQENSDKSSATHR